MTQKNRKILVTTYTSAANFANETIMGCDWYVDANRMLTIDAWRGGLRITVAQYMPGQWRSVRFTGSIVKTPDNGLTLRFTPADFSIKSISIWDAANAEPEGGDTHEEQDTSDSTGGGSPDSGAGGVQGHDDEHKHFGPGDGLLR